MSAPLGKLLREAMGRATAIIARQADACAHCGLKREKHRRPFYACPTQAQFFESAPTMEQFVELRAALDRANAIIGQQADELFALQQELDAVQKFVETTGG